MKSIAIRAVASLLLLVSSTAFADDNAADKTPGDGLHVNASLGVRAVPLGLQLGLDAGYRMELTDSESLLLKGTYVEAGASTVTSPSHFWGGAYIEALPLTVLKLRLTAQSLSYVGTFGYLHLPSDPSQSDWSLDALDKPISSGTPAHGYLLDAEATLQAKVGNFVAMVPARYSIIDMDVDRPYYDTSFDFLLAPDDQFWSIEPTIGYVFAMEQHDTWVLTGLRWQHAETIETNLTRDMATLLGMWKLPGTLSGGEMKWVALGGYWATHPNRQGDIYFATQFAVDWRF